MLPYESHTVWRATLRCHMVQEAVQQDRALQTAKAPSLGKCAEQGLGECAPSQAAMPVCRATPHPRRPYYTDITRLACFLLEPCRPEPLPRSRNTSHTLTKNGIRK